jgi:hypothetical protein
MSVSPLRGSGLRDRGVVRIVDTVRRPAGHWRESVHDLLRHLRREGLAIVPEPLGTDAEGREVVRFLPGRDQGWPFRAEIVTDEGAFELGRLATALREAMSTYRCPPGARWHSRDGRPGDGESGSIRHGCWSSASRLNGSLPPGS